MTVKIKGGLIVSVSKTNKADMQEVGYATIDGKGLFMCPGLIDCKFYWTYRTDSRPHAHHCRARQHRERADGEQRDGHGAQDRLRPEG